MDITAYLQAVAALFAVLGLIGAIAWAARRYGFAGGVAVGRGGGRQRRLAVVEVLALDARRRLILVRRDGVEHLLLTGAGNGADLVIETAIPSPAAPAPTEGP